MKTPKPLLLILASMLALAGSNPAFAAVEEEDLGEDEATEKHSALPKLRYSKDGFDAGVNRLRLETGMLTDNPRGTDSSHYLHGNFGLHWKPNAHWELRAGPRVDAFFQSGAQGYEKASLDYGDNFIGYRSDKLRLTFGTQTVIWGRIDELPPTDRLSRVDLTRFILDRLPDRRRSQLTLRMENFLGGGFKTDILYVPIFRPAELPEWDSVWSPVDRTDGRLLGIAEDPMLAAVVRQGRFGKRTSGSGGAGIRLSYSGKPMDFALTFQRVRQSVPYYRFSEQARNRLFQGYPLNLALRGLDEAALTEIHPFAWVGGADFEFQTKQLTWRFETTYTSDVPVTTAQFHYQTVPALDWVGGVEWFPKKIDARVNLQVYGRNLFTPDVLLDRRAIYGLNGEFEYLFGNSRWRANMRFYFGLDRDDVYVNPKLSYLGFEPVQIYLAGHLFDGDQKTLGGFHKNHNYVLLGAEVRY